jgi:hypothetical protein
LVKFEITNIKQQAMKLNLVEIENSAIYFGATAAFGSFDFVFGDGQTERLCH